MQPLAFLWFELQFVQHYFRETFEESQVPAKARMAPSLFRNRRIYEACNKTSSVDSLSWAKVMPRSTISR
jgi:hypothetical protein